MTTVLPSSPRRFIPALLAYLVPSFIIAYLWHLVVFHKTYEALAIYRDDLIVPFGFLTMIIQGSIFASAYPRLFTTGPWLPNGLKYGLLAGLLSWSFTTLAVAAKFPMTSIPTFMITETCFTIVQFAAVGPLTAWVCRLPEA